MSEKKSYSHLKSELDQLMDRFESSSHNDVDQMLVDYKKASDLIKQLESYLEEAQKSFKESTNKA